MPRGPVLVHAGMAAHDTSLARIAARLNHRSTHPPRLTRSFIPQSSGRRQNEPIITARERIPCPGDDATLADEGVALSV